MRKCSKGCAGPPLISHLFPCLPSNCEFTRAFHSACSAISSWLQVSGFNGSYKKGEVEENAEAFELLRAQFDKPQADLEALMKLAWPDQAFSVFHETP